jgi:hypothetical protein
MPNHIQNKLELIGSEADVKRVRESINSQGTPIDFNKIKPMPEDLSIEVHSGIETAVEVALKMDLDDNELISSLQQYTRVQSKTPLDFDDKDWELFIKCLNNVKKYGVMYWYTWAIKNWGTKWNAYSVDDSRTTDNIIYFQTAWSGVLNLIEIVSAKFPNVSFKYSFADEDTGSSNAGVYEIRNGKVINRIEPKSQSREAYELAFELNPDQKYLYKLVGDKYEYNEEL